jgi:hypothetical protein
MSHPWLLLAFARRAGDRRLAELLASRLGARAPTHTPLSPSGTAQREALAARVLAELVRHLGL